MKKKIFKQAFTLAETMIVLVVLGVIAMVTVPALISKHTETANRTKLKKAMSVYDTALNKMVIENGIKDNAALYENANSFAPEGNCTNTAPYFKVTTTLNNNICTFKAPDGLYWDITKINAPILAFKEADLNDETSENRYQLVGHFDNSTGSLRVDDLQYETGGANEAALAKVYGFINNSKVNENSNCNSLCQKFADYTKQKCSDDSSTLISGSTNRYSNSSDSKSCIFDFGSGYAIYDNNGHRIAEYEGNCGFNNPNTTLTDCTEIAELTHYDSNGNYEARLTNCNTEGKCLSCSGDCEKYKRGDTITHKGYKKWVEYGSVPGGYYEFSSSPCNGCEESTFDELINIYYE